jgi:transcriptional regulator with XRE-family HTH domain
MRDWRAIFGRNVHKYRQLRKLTQEKLAFEAEIDLTYMGGIERGKRNPSLLVMARIADALSVPLARLLSDQYWLEPAEPLKPPVRKTTRGQ